MTKFEDNLSPYLTEVEQGSTPANPASGNQKLFIRTSDHLLCYVNSSGTVTPVSSGLADQGVFTYLDGTVAAAPGTPASGKLRLYAKTGKVLAVKDDTGAETVLGSGGSGALVLLEQHTASSSATLDFTTFISSTYDDYLFELLGIKNATNTVSLIVRVGTGGGPTYDSGSNYVWSHVDVYPVSSGIEGSTSDTSITLGGSADNSHQGVTGAMHLFEPQSAAFKTFTYDTVRWVASGINVPVRDTGSAEYASTTAITAIRFLFSSGNIASGTIRVYGIAKS